MIKPYPNGKKKRGLPITDEPAELLADWFAELDDARHCRARHAKGSRCRSVLAVHDAEWRVLHYFHFKKYVWRTVGGIPPGQPGGAGRT